MYLHLITRWYMAIPYRMMMMMMMNDDEWWVVLQLNNGKQPTTMHGIAGLFSARRWSFFHFGSSQSACPRNIGLAFRHGESPHSHGMLWLACCSCSARWGSRSPARAGTERSLQPEKHELHGSRWLLHFGAAEQHSVDRAFNWRSGHDKVRILSDLGCARQVAKGFPSAWHN